MVVTICVIAQLPWIYRFAANTTAINFVCPRFTILVLQQLIFFILLLLTLFYNQKTIFWSPQSLFFDGLRYLLWLLHTSKYCIQHNLNCKKVCNTVLSTAYVRLWHTFALFQNLCFGNIIWCAQCILMQLLSQGNRRSWKISLSNQISSQFLGVRPYFFVIKLYTGLAKISLYQTFHYITTLEVTLKNPNKYTS